MNLKLTRPIAFVDVEATGAGRVDPVKYRIVSVAIVTLGFDCFPIGRPYHTLVNPGVPISPETTAIHGITDEMVKDAPRFEAIVAELHHRLIGRDIGGYNAGGFDVQILYEESLRAGNELKCLLDAKIIDPGMIFKKREERSLPAAVKFFCGPRNGRRARCAQRRE
jgi:DNA polymerase-3 subunit epsilon